MKEIPGWAWLAAAGVLAFVVFRRHPAVAPANAPIPPGHQPDSGDRTAQNPKVVPWRGY